MNTRLLARCALASAGAFAFFTAALATPAQCRFGVPARPALDTSCETARPAPGAQSSGERARLVSVSVVAGRNAARTLLDGRSATREGLCVAERETRCWANALMTACVVRTATR